MSNINITATDVDALARVAYAEAANVFTYYKGQGYSDADATTMSYGMVIDIIINRVAAGSSTIYGSTIQDVIDKPSQFEAVGIAGGSWTDLSSVSSPTLTLIENYLASRASGTASIVGAATDYLNPTVTGGISAWEGTGSGQGWGQIMKNMEYFGARPFNSDGSLNTGGGSGLISHVTGNANNLRPDPYSITYDSVTSDVFNIPHDRQIPILNIPHGPGAVDLSCPLPIVITSEVQPCFASAISAASPLVIDLSASHTGVTLSSWGVSTETFFDLNDNGFAVQTAWVSGDTGLLARDLNSNALIDSSAELFGSPTVDGFAKLAALDSNHDLRIDNNDDAWSSLVVWTDTNGDAVTQSGELHTLSSLNIINIDLAAVASSTSTVSGNPISHTSKVTFSGGATATIADAWFVHDNTNSYYTGDYTLDAETLFLPALRGYGTLPDFTIAMSTDSDLKDLVAVFAANFSMNDFAAADNLKAAIEEILFTWAGVESVHPASRGTFVDAQHLEFIERMLGTDYIQMPLNSPNPWADAAALIEEAYVAAYDMLSAALVAQVGAAALFEGAVSYNPVTGTFTGNTALSDDAIGDLTALAPSPGAANLAFWEAIGRFIDNVRGFDNLTNDEEDWLDDAVNASDSSLHWSDILYSISHTTPGMTVNGTSGADTLSGGAFGDTISGYDGGDTIHGYDGRDSVFAGNGNDIIYGDGDRDELYGESGNDTLYGGAGNDTLDGGGDDDALYGEGGGNILNGGSGNDTYYYGSGNDLIFDAGGTDQIILPSGIVAGDLTFARVSTGGSSTEFSDLLISIDGGISIQIETQYYSTYKIETLVFSDSSTINLSTLNNVDAYLTAGNDNFGSTDTSDYNVYGFDGDDTIFTVMGGTHVLDGGNGNDLLKGGSGNDTYIASTGFDTIQENSGTDTIVVPEGITLGDVTFYRIRGTSGLTDDLGISISGLGQIAVVSHFGSYAVEYMHFLEDSSTISLTNLSIATIGTSGSDSIYPPSTNAGADDIIDGREGDDNLYGGLGNDTYFFSEGHDRIDESGGGGSDTIVVRDEYAPEDVTISYIPNAGSYTSNDLLLTDADGNTLLVYRHANYTANMMEHVSFSDSTVWDLASMEIETLGTGGNDYLNGHDIGDASSDDTIYGFAGADTIDAGAGDDIVYAGDGNDYVYASAGSDQVHGGDGADELRGKDYNVLYGDAGDDTLYGNPYNEESHVTLFGGDGADTLYGSRLGETALHGGAGSDTLVSHYGTDTFFFEAVSAFDAVDTIQQFNITYEHDKIDISDVLDGYYDPLTDLITDFVQISTNGSNSELYVDTSGSATFGAGQHIATIQGLTGLTDEAALVTAGTLLAA